MARYLDCDEPDDSDEPYDFEEDGPQFARPGSALRRATRDDPRIHPCPTCGELDRLTGHDVALGYQCDACADADERGY